MTRTRSAWIPKATHFVDSDSIASETTSPAGLDVRAWVTPSDDFRIDSASANNGWIRDGLTVAVELIANPNCPERKRATATVHDAERLAWSVSARTLNRTGTTALHLTTAGGDGLTLFTGDAATLADALDQAATALRATIAASVTA